MAKKNNEVLGGTEGRWDLMEQKRPGRERSRALLWLVAIRGSLEHPEILRPVVNQPSRLAGLRHLAVPASVCATPGPPWSSETWAERHWQTLWEEPGQASKGFLSVGLHTWRIRLRVSKETDARVKSPVSKSQNGEDFPLNPAVCSRPSLFKRSPQGHEILCVGFYCGGFPGARVLAP